MKYAKCHFDKAAGRVCDDDGSLEWREGTFEEAKNHVEANKSCCVLFFPGDVQGRGVPVKPDVSREEFEVNPAVYGVCFYHGWRGYVFE